ncbi:MULTISPECIES: MFS transporter [Pseudomonas]|uniref:MFS transporter n=1 Tax=Pseudomonas TaxID=286 RepID=UPI000C88E3B3|nr:MULTISPECIES: MFS transporter [Pseudomonas]AZC49179.1 putative MFS-type transporter [Pseudomonas chlororaphis subsp. piscium]AZC55807.1 putative MFS-type transporter [Pseudomonas chlororaphis subsp. piscium]AZC68305.1 putative MFS-type transporter [Pseudomonas chlororaphis subsp. piscium]AZC74494.1 putative MFS-type transporter [Pseudomonas chlororaphis subsp. piscium]AZC80710.1 putative MFS-type transporter [Pseudomonas chlororaphis subsp. piscium]
MSPLIRLLASFIALMMAMGIGRFALTPQLPHLLSEGQVDLTDTGLIAAANYLGYFIGALDAMCARRPAQVRRRLLGGLWLCVLLTLASFWAGGFWAHSVLRFGTGVASAWVMVMIAALSQPLAHAAGRPRLGALVFAGPGLGIFLTGLLALGSNLLGQSSATLWLVYAATALLMLLAILPILPQPATPALTAQMPQASNHAGIPRLGLVYALYGLGYIIPATFLSQMASARFQGQWQADLFWPCFGLAAAVGVGLVSLRRHSPNATRHWLMATLWLQAAGVFACLLGNGAGLALGVMLCGTPFLACMQLVMQRSRELAPHATQRNAGLLTACFAMGQLSGPLLAALSSHFSGGLQPALIVAGSSLLLAGVLLLRQQPVARECHATA